VDTFKYKTGVAGTFSLGQSELGPLVWLDVPLSAIHGTYAGTFELRYPEATEYDSWGRPASTIGLPIITIRSTMITASGMEFWNSFFNNLHTTFASASLSIPNSHTGVTEYYAGVLSRPRWDRLQIGSGCTSTVYHGFNITMECQDRIDFAVGRVQLSRIKLGPPT